LAQAGPQREVDHPAHDGSGDAQQLTDYWAGHEIKQGEEFAILTNIIHEEWSGISIKEHKNLKGLKARIFAII